MTGFGRGVAENDEIRVVIELRSVNHRFLDLSLRMGRHFRHAESAAAAVLRQRLGRGRVELFLEREELRPRGREVRTDTELAQAVLDGVRQLEGSLGITVPDEALAARILRQDGVLQIEELPLDVSIGEEVLLSALGHAIDALLSMRATEGERLRADLSGRAERIATLLAEVEGLASAAPVRVQERIRHRLAELVDEGVVDPERVAQEAALLADKADITEEITRLRAHLDQAAEMLAAGGVVGRRLDFLVQELNREVNTIGSKCQEVGMHALVIEMKSEVEKIREQVQNLE